MSKLSHVRRSIRSEAAALAVAQAVAHGRTLGVAVCAAVVDASGVLTALLRAEDSPLHAVGIAQDKAYTAVSFGLASGDWQQRLAERGEMLRLGLSAQPRFAGFGGGLPVLEEGVRIGAIGVSGGSEAQDIACAQAALDCLAERS